MKKNAKIYVAGHNGLVGSAIVRKLTIQKYTNVICRPHSELDLTSQASVSDFFKRERPEYVFLAAARVGGILANDTYPADFIRDNILIQTNIIESAYRNRVKRLLFLGSSCIYPKLAQQPIKESSLMTGPLESTNSAYAIAKISGVEMCWSYNRQYGTQFIPVMPTNLYGPGDNFDLKTSHVLPALIRKFHLAKFILEENLTAVIDDEKHFGLIPEDIKTGLGFHPISSVSELGEPSSSAVTIWGSGTPRREFLHVDDLADACIFLMELDQDIIISENISPILINIGTGKDITINELASLVKRIIGFEGSVVYDKSKPDGTPRKLMDVSLLSSLGWSYKIDLEQGIEQTYRWYIKQIAHGNQK